jgi:ATP-dependent exoDNAse (exonuclease V) beta subunit
VSALPDTARARIRGELDSTVVVVAGAGTGKTTALVSRVIELVRTGTASLRDMAVITFTEAAAAELRQRVRQAVEDEARRAPRHAPMATALHEVDEAAICTLHAFAQRMLVEHCVAAGIPPGFEILDDTAERADFEARWTRFADVLLADRGAEAVLVRGFSLGLNQLGLADLAGELHAHWDRLEDGGLQALCAARPQAGDWPPADPGTVLAALDDALALAGHCSDHDDKLAVHLHEVIAAARAELASCPDEQAALRVLDNLPSLRCTHGQQANWGGRIDEVRAACAASQQARLDLLAGARQQVVTELGARLAEFVMTVAEERRIEGRLGFHDLLVHARRLLRDDRAAAQALRRRYRRLLIDEFQDTDPIQIELAARLAATVEGSADLRRARPRASRLAPRFSRASRF